MVTTFQLSKRLEKAAKDSSRNFSDVAFEKHFIYKRKPFFSEV